MECRESNEGAPRNQWKHRERQVAQTGTMDFGPKARVVGSSAVAKLGTGTPGISESEPYGFDT